jgi:hypothetical protein
VTCFHFEGHKRYSVFYGLGKALQVIKVEGQELVNFDPAYWEYESAQAKIVVYFPRNELKIVWEEPFTYSRLSACMQFRGFLTQNIFGRFLLKTWYNKLTNIPVKPISRTVIPVFFCALNRNAKQVMAEYRERQNVQIKKQSVYLKQSQVLGKDLWPKSSYLD